MQFMRAACGTQGLHTRLLLKLVGKGRLLSEGIAVLPIGPCPHIRTHLFMWEGYTRTLTCSPRVCKEPKFGCMRARAQVYSGWQLVSRTLTAASPASVWFIRAARGT